VRGLKSAIQNPTKHVAIKNYYGEHVINCNDQNGISPLADIILAYCKDSYYIGDTPFSLPEMNLDAGNKLDKNQRKLFAIDEKIPTRFEGFCHKALFEFARARSWFTHVHSLINLMTTYPFTPYAILDSIKSSASSAPAQQSVSSSSDAAAAGAASASVAKIPKRLMECLVGNITLIDEIKASLVDPKQLPSSNFVTPYKAASLYCLNFNAWTTNCIFGYLWGENLCPPLSSKDEKFTTQFGLLKQINRQVCAHQTRQRLADYTKKAEKLYSIIHQNENLKPNGRGIKRIKPDLDTLVDDPTNVDPEHDIYNGDPPISLKKLKRSAKKLS
jgi:hypothetical protein